MIEEALPSLSLIRNPGPARDLWGTAAQRESYHPEAMLESWIATHGSAGREDQRIAVRCVLDLRAIGIPAADLEGNDALRLPGAQRLDVLKHLGVDGLLALREADQGPRTLPERVFQDLLESRQIEGDFTDRTFVHALNTVAPWAIAAGIKLGFDPKEIEEALSGIDFLRTLGGADLHRFVGRNKLRQDLRGIWRAACAGREAPVLIEGAGGVGKSLALSRFIADVLASAADDRPDAVFHIDFDRLSLQQARPSTILQQLVRQTAQWWVRERSDELLDLSRDLSRGGAGLEAITESVRHSDAFGNDQYLASRLVRLINDQRPPKIILFVDSFEQVETFDEFAARSPGVVENILADVGAYVLSIYGSRAFAAPYALSSRAPIRLHQFSVEQAQTYLHLEASRAGFEINASTAGRVMEAVGRSPLNLRLAIALLEKEGASFNPATWADLARNSPELRQAALYDRVLRRIRDEELRKVAFPGLLVRRLTMEVIDEILAIPCRLELAKASPATLMQKARREGQLFTVDPPDGLLHRQDVRAALLPTIDASVSPALAREINERAVKFYAARKGALNRAEELYHRLRLNQSASTIDERWTDEAGRLLRSAMEEFSPASRAYLRDRLGSVSILGVETTGETGHGARSGSNEGPDGTQRELRLYALRVFQSGKADETLLQLLTEREYNRLDGPLGDVYGQTLVALNRQDQLLSEAIRLQFPEAILSIEPEAAAGVCSVIATVLEGRNVFEPAGYLYGLALQVLSNTKSADRRRVLGPLIGEIRIMRKIGDDDERRHLIAWALPLLVAVQKTVYEQRVLARETAAELGEVIIPEQGDSHHEHEAVQRLLRVVFETNEGFPSAMLGGERLAELSEVFGYSKGFKSATEVNDFCAKLLYSVSDDRMRVVRAMRDEVDWTLRRTAGVDSGDDNLGIRDKRP